MKTTDPTHPAMRTAADRDTLERIACTLHETRMKFCYMPGYQHNQPWPQRMPPDFGYVPQPWVDIAWEQAKAILAMLSAPIEGESKP